MPKGIPGSRGTCTIDDCDEPHKARGRCGTHYRAWQYQNLTKPRHDGREIQAETREPFDLIPAEVAWLAGLFEGEGCINDHGPSSVRLSIKMTDRDVIERVCALTGKTPGSYNRPGYDKTLWSWTVSWRPDVEELLRVMLPWFGQRRRERAIEALQRLQEQTRPIGVPVGFEETNATGEAQIG